MDEAINSLTNTILFGLSRFNHLTGSLLSFQQLYACIQFSCGHPPRQFVGKDVLERSRVVRGNQGIPDKRNSIPVE